MVHPREETLVALDLETTGINASRDRVIEVGAVKFRGDEELERFDVLVNPGIEIPPFVSNLTGITQKDVDFAPEWHQLRDDVDAFIGDCRLVGHRIRFDIGFLRANGVDVTGGSYDTFDLARLALPAGPEFGLGRLVEHLGISHDAPHRALPDAVASKDLFLVLLGEIEKMPTQMLSTLSRLASDSVWSMASLARSILEARQDIFVDGDYGHHGFDQDALIQKLVLKDVPRFPPDVDSSSASIHDDFVERVDELFATAGPLARALPGFEERLSQREMARAVAKSLCEGTNAIVEAGTGIGKTLAYLIPAAMYSQETGAQVVVSTNTINLQEQLLNKDFAVVRDVLRQLTGQELQAAQLKGRSNYLCYKRWIDAIGQQQSVPGDARVLAQCLTWLGSTNTGDSAELALSFDTGRFRQYSAEGCPPSRGRPSYPCKGPPCFMLKARSRAGNADVVIVNHSLLILDRINATGIVSENAALIIDEAHHLQATATDQLGFWIRESELMSDLDSLADPTGVMQRLANLAARLNPVEASSDPASDLQSQVYDAVRGARRHGRRFFAELQQYTSDVTRRQSSREMRILGSTRIDAQFRPVVEQWAEFAPELNRIIQAVNKMLTAIGEDAGEDDATVINAAALLESVVKCRMGLEGAVEEPDPNYVYWATVDERRELDVEVRGAPLDVSDVLNEKLFSTERPTVLTGATLSLQGDFDRFASDVGIGECDELSLASPFDFQRAALIVVPEDIPAPNEPGYADAVERMLKAVCDNTDGRTLALFTANSALSNAHSVLYQHLSGGETTLLAQGRDGPPARVLRLLNESDRALALGSMAMWEGIDLEDASIKTLVMTRLPFPVPTDPIHASRSERMDNPFNDYMVPQAVLKFRQGFGRLIRSHSDRGVFVILDRRILTMRYGTRFQRALPRCTVQRVTLATLGEYVGRWHNYGEV